ncbi:MAG: hypothetical protein ORN98_05865 [Alphaproteobacteria bacterium]|nr:hypothetical protein [Alphaproteobacteria bacterium]
MRNADMNYHAELGQFQADLLALSLPAYGGLEARGVAVYPVRGIAGKARVGATTN